MNLNFFSSVILLLGLFIFPWVGSAAPQSVCGKKIFSEKSRSSKLDRYDIRRERSKNEVSLFYPGSYSYVFQQGKGYDKQFSVNWKQNSAIIYSSAIVDMTHRNDSRYLNHPQIHNDLQFKDNSGARLTGKHLYFGVWRPSVVENNARVEPVFSFYIPKHHLPINGHKKDYFNYRSTVNSENKMAIHYSNSKEILTLVRETNESEDGATQPTLRVITQIKLTSGDPSQSPEWVSVVKVLVNKTPYGTFFEEVARFGTALAPKQTITFLHRFPRYRSDFDTL